MSGDLQPATRPPTCAHMHTKQTHPSGRWSLKHKARKTFFIYKWIPWKRKKKERSQVCNSLSVTHNSLNRIILCFCWMCITPPESTVTLLTKRLEKMSHCCKKKRVRSSRWGLWACRAVGVRGGAAEDKTLLSGGGLGPPFLFWNDSVFWFEEEKAIWELWRSTMWNQCKQTPTITWDTWFWRSPTSKAC